MSKDTRAKRTQRMQRPDSGGTPGGKKLLDAKAAKGAALAAVKREEQRQHKRRDQQVQDHEYEALYGTGGLTYDHWQPQRITTRGYERCDHVPHVAAGLSRECRTRVEICERCRCWRLAPPPTPKAPLVSFAYEGPFCVLPAYLIGHRARKRGARAEEAA